MRGVAENGVRGGRNPCPNPAIQVLTHLGFQRLEATRFSEVEPSADPLTSRSSIGQAEEF
jgi:hypothetical protein